MGKTSFGSLQPIFKIDSKINIEYLIFEKEGRAHQHNEYESFFVTAGQGIIVNGEERVSVKPGDLVLVNPNTDHWMIPEGNTPLEGFLWHHQAKTVIR